ncbi:hypothetical protein S58_10780 [Bradyrhizobium oligotrophicum S58]|uniref:Uncharacterized protein n=1 Tax=Bradyrhizobium oligotrophicum S58 TaxID=1245469 RepID=M4Z268_9BRAD|nr:hypothetical protein [Bradyrhizobium oligotrophicum]BAM87089.1 hypothetical protein S58_10780 [Bradyrhizobium oligotrophicum S58]
MTNVTGSTVWGVVGAKATIQPGSSKNFSVASSEPGTYILTFNPPFAEPPAIVGTQCQFNEPGPPITESTQDGLVFPQVTPSSAIVLTGNSVGTRTPRAFSFVAMGIRAS